MISGAVYSLQAANTVTAAAIVTDVAIVVATTLHQDVQFLLLTLAPAGGVSYAANTQQPPVYPYMTWLRIASTPNVSLRGPSTLQNTRVQIDIYSRNVVEAVALETALEAAFAAWAVQNVPLLSFDLIDPETRSYRVTKEYSVWARN